MLFAQIIAFILVMVVFEAYQPQPPEFTPLESLLSGLFVAICLRLAVRLTVKSFLRRLAGPRPPANPAQAARRLIAHLHAAAVLGLFFITTFLDLKAQLLTVPVLASSETLLGLCAVALYFFLLLLVWHGVYPLEREVLRQDISRDAYVEGQVRFVAPVIFPWLAVGILRDFLASLWPQGQAWLNTSWGDLVFLSFFLFLMALFFPPLVRVWWGCRRWPAGPVRELTEAVLKRAGVSVAGILSWPILQGQLITAGIMGLFPHFRYLLLTPALTKALSAEELAGVVAHEAGHVRHRHLLFYLLFFLGFFLAVFSLSEPLGYLLGAILIWAAGTGWGEALLSSPERGGGLLSVILALPLLICLVVYLRYVMGFFMRHFERQADFYALGLTGRAAPLVGALEKVAGLSGDIRELPSWHHFSIAQRVEALYQAQADPGRVRGQAGLIKKALIIYLAGLALVAGLGLASSALDWGQGLERRLAIRQLERRVLKAPQDHRLRMTLGVLRFESGQERAALSDLETAVRLAPTDPEALNSLAWLWVTAKDKTLRRPREALALALMAVRLNPAPHIWDTLAEAYFANRKPKLAEAAARSALAAGPRDKIAYYQSQLQRFEQAARAERPSSPER